MIEKPKLYKCYKATCNRCIEGQFYTEEDLKRNPENNKILCPDREYDTEYECGIKEVDPKDLPKPPVDKKKLFLIGGGILGVLLIIGAVFMFTGKSKSVATTGLIKVVETVKAVVDSSKIVIPIKTEIETLQLLINEADLILSNKEYDKAKQKYQKILTLDPGNEHAKNQLLVIEKKLQPPPPPPPPGKISKTLNFPFGYYKGETINGLRDGQGTMFFTQRQLISPNDLKKRYAESGEKVSGTWVEGNIVNGKLFDKNGEQKETLLIGH